MDYSSQPASLPRPAVLALVAFFIADLLYMPLVLGRMSLSTSLVLIAILAWTLPRWKRFSSGAIAGIAAIGVAWDLVALLAISENESVYLLSLLVLVVHLGASGYLSAYLMLAKPMKAYVSAP